MDELLAAIYDLASNTPPERVRQLAEIVRGFSSESPVSNRLDAWAVTPANKTRLDRVMKAWSSSKIESDELVGMLVGASDACRRVGSESAIELVWTGPSSQLVATRKTEQALLQVINNAREKLFLTSFVAYEVSSVMAALTESAARGVRVSMLLESSDRHGGGVSIDGIAYMREAIPSASVYFWKNKGDGFEGGKVHAKVAVCDEKLCFISSANLTNHAMEKNMEAGVLISGGSLPRRLHNHLDALATIEILKL